MENTTPLAWLVMKVGSADEIQYKLTSKVTHLGRGQGCEVPIDDQRASRRHALIRIREGDFQIEDLVSTNGTFVNGKRITKAVLSEGDSILIGDTVLHFHLEVDLDKTIIAERKPSQTIATQHVTKPRTFGTIPCLSCGQPNPEEGKFCFECGAVLPQIPKIFLQTQEKYGDLKSAHEAGELTDDQFQAELKELIVQNDEGEYWMVGAESGEWYWYNGEKWTHRTPPLIFPEKKDETFPKPTPSLTPDKVPPSPGRFKWRRRSVLGIWLLGLLFVLGFGYYIENVVARGILESLISQRVPEIPIEVSESFTDQGNEDVLTPPSGESTVPPQATIPFSVAEDAEPGYNIRRYTHTTDSALPSITADAEYLADQSTELNSVYRSVFPPGSPGVLVMAWCAIDQATLDQNMTLIEMQGTLDEVLIPESIWTSADLQEEGIACRVYQAVLEDLQAGTHRFLWETSYNEAIFDGWETFQPGVYLKDFIIEVGEGSEEGVEPIADGYRYTDNFDIDGGHWGEMDRDEVKAWVEGGNLHIEIYQASLSAISHFQDREFSDFYLSTTVYSVNDAPGMYGIIFRHQDDQHYYFFQVTDQGLFRLGKRVGATVEIIPWTESEFISGRGEENTLAVSMVGDLITAYINDHQVAELQDTTYIEGSLSLIAGTPQGVNNYHAAFTQVTIEAPE